MSPSNLIPAKDLKNVSRVSQLCQSIDEPIYITEDGSGADMVLMNINVYEKLKKEKYIYDNSPAMPVF